MEITFLWPRKYFTLSSISFVPNPQIVQNVMSSRMWTGMIRSLVPQQAWNDAIRGCPRAENDDPDDISAVMSHSDTLTTNVPLLIGGESTTPVNFAATAGTDIPGECMQCERLKNSLRKYQKEKSSLKRINLKLREEIKSVGHVLMSLQSTFLYNLSLWIAVILQELELQ